MQVVIIHHSLINFYSKICFKSEDHVFDYVISHDAKYVYKLTETCKIK